MTNDAVHCSRCGGECDPPVITDAAGDPVCVGCLDAPEVPPAEPANATEEVDDGTYALVEDEFEPAPSPCPSCGKPMGALAVICTSCGFDRRSGAVAHQETPREMERREKDQLVAAERMRQVYLQPLIVLLIAASIATAAVVYQEGAVAGLVYILQYAIKVPLGLFVFWLCCLMWIGLDAPARLTALRLAAIYACTDVAIVAVPIPVAGALVAAVVFVGMLMSMLDLDLVDALGYLFFSVWVFVGIAYIIAVSLP